MLLLLQLGLAPVETKTFDKGFAHQTGFLMGRIPPRPVVFWRLLIEGDLGCARRRFCAPLTWSVPQPPAYIYVVV